MGSGRETEEVKSGLTSGHPQPYTRSKGAADHVGLPRPFSFLGGVHNGVMPESSHAARVTRLALWFEGALGAGALAFGWLVGHCPAIGMQWERSAAAEELQAAAGGLLATLPLLAVLFVIDRFPLGPLRTLRDKAQSLILGMFGGASILQLAVVALAAGVGEELLFRGLIQAGLSRLIGGPYATLIGLVLASVVFGVCHWLDTTYAVLAALAGAYFGWLLLASGSLWTPIVAHATYDFLALAYLVQPNRLLRSSV